MRRALMICLAALAACGQPKSVQKAGTVFLRPQVQFGETAPWGSRVGMVSTSGGSGIVTSVQCIDSSGNQFPARADGWCYAADAVAPSPPDLPPGLPPGLKNTGHGWVTWSGRPVDCIDWNGTHFQPRANGYCYAADARKAEAGKKWSTDASFLWAHENGVDCRIRFTAVPLKDGSRADPVNISTNHPRCLEFMEPPQDWWAPSFHRLGATR